jgi:hypothetical protein
MGVKSLSSWLREQPELFLAVRHTVGSPNHEPCAMVFDLRALALLLCRYISATSDRSGDYSHLGAAAHSVRPPLRAALTRATHHDATLTCAPAVPRGLRRCSRRCGWWGSSLCSWPRAG